MKTTVKEWHEIQTEYETMCKMSCVPAYIKKLPNNHVIDEEQSVKWNREQVEDNNRRYQEEVARLNTLKNKTRDSIMSDIYTTIRNDVGHDISIEKARAIWDYAYELGHASGFYDILSNLYDVTELADKLLS